MKKARVVGFVAVSAAFSALMFYYALTVPIYLDDSDGLVRFQRSPTWFEEPIARWWAIDHPAVHRWVNYAALKVGRVEIGEIPQVNSQAGYKWNKDHGRLAPWGPVRYLRCVNVVSLMGALLCLAALAKLVTGNWGWGLLVVAPLALSRPFGGGLGSFIFTDAHLTFFLALMILVWVKFHLSENPLGWKRVIIMGVIAGLACSSKYNAALALLAYMAYLAIAARGKMRLWAPLAAAGTAFLVFVVVNPVMWQGGPVWWGRVLSDMLKRRLDLIEAQEDFYGAVTFGRKFLRIFPQWWALPLFAWVAWRARLERWFTPVLLWTLFLSLGTLFTIHETFNRYLMPIYMPVTVLTMLSVIAVCGRRPLDVPDAPSTRDVS